MSENLTKVDLANAVAEKCGTTKKDAGAVVEAIFETIADILKDGGEVSISGFGKFEVAERAARAGVNPANGEKIQIPASKAPKFKAAKALKDSVK